MEGDIVAALRLNLVSGIGPRVYGELIKAFGSPAEVLAAAPDKLRSISGVGSKLVRAIADASETINVDEQIEICKHNNIKTLNQNSKNYPKRLTEIYDPPSVLFCKGNILSADDIAIAIVGSRLSLIHI